MDLDSPRLRNHKGFIENSLFFFWDTFSGDECWAELVTFFLHTLGPSKTKFNKLKVILQETNK
jgi:hypothetical protein